MQTDTVNAKLKFLADIDGELIYVPSKGGGDATDHIGNFTDESVTIHNGRTLMQESSLDAEGFMLVRQETAVADFYDDAQIENVYHPELKSLLNEYTGATRVEIFDDTRRSSSLDTQRSRGIREPASIAHNDYTAASGVKRLNDLYPDEASELLQRRFAIVNVWRSIAGPIENYSLVMCDATTLDDRHLVAIERRAEERVGELQVVLHDASQRWYHFPRMQMDEALLFKTFDSETDGRTRFTVHSSFDDPTAPPDAAPRESIETRCFLFF